MVCLGPWSTAGTSLLGLGQNPAEIDLLLLSVDLVNVDLQRISHSDDPPGSAADKNGPCGVIDEEIIQHGRKMHQPAEPKLGDFYEESKVTHLGDHRLVVDQGAA